MRFNQQRTGEKELRMNAATIATETRWMLHQLCLPIEPTDSIKARRERAIRRAGISRAKGVRLWYGQACSILAEEFFQIAEAYKRLVVNQETRLTEELELLKALKERGKQHDLDLPASARSVAEMDNAS